MTKQAITPSPTNATLGLVEEGEAFARLTRATRRERLDVIVIGGGQAGLSVGHHLAKTDLRFVILDASERTGDPWRHRWDSLRLFTPAKFDGLDGMPFPAPPNYFPTKDEMADYLEAYVERFALPVRNGYRVDRLWREGKQYVVRAGEDELEADQVVVAMANYQRPSVPDFASELDPGIVQLHSSEYRRPSQLREGSVLIAGAGNSGAEIAMELADTHRVCLSGRSTGHLPFRIGGWLARVLLVRLVLRFLFHRVLTVQTPMGQKARSKTLGKGGPLIRTRPRDLAEAGVERAPRIVGVRRGLPLMEDGRVLEVDNVVWSTGFHPGFSWIDAPVFGTEGQVLHEQGVATQSPGLYFVGLHFLYSMSSVMIHGVGRDAARIVRAVVTRETKRRTSVARSGKTLVETRPSEHVSAAS
jgi:putative flavoprotein involved in K+ transport